MHSRSIIADPYEDDPELIAERLKIAERRKNLFKALYVIPTVNALYAALQLMLGARSLNWSRFGIISLGMITLVSNLGIGRKFTLGGMTDIQAIFEGEDLPSDFLPLTRKQLIACIALSVVIAGYAIFADVMMTFFYGKELPYDLKFNNATSDNIPLNSFHQLNTNSTPPFKDELMNDTPTGWPLLAFCIVLAVMQGLGDLCSFGIATHKSLGEMVSNKPVKYIHTPSKWISNIGGIGLGVPYAIGPALGSIYLIDKCDCGIPGMIAVTAASPLIAYSTYSLNGRFIRDSINDLFFYFGKLHLKQKYPPFKDVVPFAASNGLSFVTFYASIGLTDLFLEDILYRFNIPSRTAVLWTNCILSYLIAAGQYLITLSSLYPIMHSLGSLMIANAPLIRDRIHQRFFAPAPITDKTAFVTDISEIDDDELEAPALTDAVKPRDSLLEASLVDAAFGADDDLDPDVSPMHLANNPSSLFGRISFAPASPTSTAQQYQP